ncbi:hypothetical protein QAD02_002834 [Eretmocerus hayati]|uniref:Uncharacterized protein n=1 Tax=Eretmocerus hayati TaxID=131215 RepID=A0ACC2NK03_9HYME|nr:hypothetical protein QAD02_002834 [Eretmocerus hayati]
MQAKTSGKRKEEERSPENKTIAVVKRKFTEHTKGESDTGSERFKKTEQQLQENQQDMEELRKMIGSMHEDMKNMEGKMMGRMDSLLKELKTENERRAEELDKRITNLEIKEREERCTERTRRENGALGRIPARGHQSRPNKGSTTTNSGGHRME